LPSDENVPEIPDTQENQHFAAERKAGEINLPLILSVTESSKVMHMKRSVSAPPISHFFIPPVAETPRSLVAMLISTNANVSESYADHPLVSTNTITLPSEYVWPSNEGVASEEFENITAKSLTPMFENITAKSLTPVFEKITAKSFTPEFENFTAKSFPPEFEKITDKSFTSEFEKIETKSLTPDLETITSKSVKPLLISPPSVTGTFNTLVVSAAPPVPRSPPPPPPLLGRDSLTSDFGDYFNPTNKEEGNESEDDERNDKYGYHLTNSFTENKIIAQIDQTKLGHLNRDVSFDEDIASANRNVSFEEIENSKKIFPSLLYKAMAGFDGVIGKSCDSSHNEETGVERNLSNVTDDLRTFEQSTTALYKHKVSNNSNQRGYLQSSILQKSGTNDVDEQSDKISGYIGQQAFHKNENLEQRNVLKNDGVVFKDVRMDLAGKSLVVTSGIEISKPVSASWSVQKNYPTVNKVQLQVHPISSSLHLTPATSRDSELKICRNILPNITNINTYQRIGLRPNDRLANKHTSRGFTVITKPSFSEILSSKDNTTLKTVPKETEKLELGYPLAHKNTAKHVLNYQVHGDAVYSMDTSPPRWQADANRYEAAVSGFRKKIELFEGMFKGVRIQ